jgi:hypothetical protein
VATQEEVKEMKLIVHRITVNHENIRAVIQKEKTGFFAKWRFFKPKQEEIECESIQLFYEPFVVAKAKYFVDYYKNKTYSIEIDEEVSEVIIFDQKLTPEVEKGILKGPKKGIMLDAQERVVYEAAGVIAMNRAGREIDSTKLPSAPAEPEPEETLKENRDKVREFTVSPDKIVEVIRERVAGRPKDVGKIAEEVFEVTEHEVVYTPIYEARCRHLETGEIKIIPLSGVTGKTLSL